MTDKKFTDEEIIKAIQPERIKALYESKRKEFDEAYKEVSHES